METLGKLEKVQIRDAWSGESSDFTPWLCKEETLRMLSDAVQLDLELIDREVPVGDYRLDMLAQQLGSADMVVIENQFGQTDHSHLGQLMTYAAGVGADGAGARTIIWIAERFNDSHRSALDWLNKCTEPGIRFFGVEVELWRIGNSLPAPKFNLVCKPNDWQKRLTQRTSGLSERDQFCVEYWQAFKESVAAQRCLFRLQTPRPSHYLIAALGKTGVYLSFVVTRRDEWIGCELILTDGNPIALLDRLKPHRESIDRMIPDLVWDESESRKSIKLHVHTEAVPADRMRWPKQHS